MALDINSLQSYIPAYLSPQAYSQAGGMGDYSNWLQGNMNKIVQNSGYVAMDPTYAFSQNIQSDPTGFTQAGGFPNQSQNVNKGTPNPTFGQIPNVNQDQNQATPGAINALTNPNFKNRQPSLAAGQGGWDPSTSGTANNNTQGSANYTYYSRFA